MPGINSLNTLNYATSCRTPTLKLSCSQECHAASVYCLDGLYIVTKTTALLAVSLTAWFDVLIYFCPVNASA